MKKIKWILVAAMVILSVIAWGCGERHGRRVAGKVTESINVTNGTETEVKDKLNKTVQLEVKIKYASESEEKEATSSDVTYTSNKPDVASVDSEGEITVNKEGSAEITVESVYDNAEGGKGKVVIKLKVGHVPISEMRLKSVNEYTLIRGIADEEQGVRADSTAQMEIEVKYYGSESAAATSADVKYESSDEKVASVDENGEITFNGVGKAKITATSKYETISGRKLQKSVDVTVNPVPEYNTGLEVIWFETGYEDNGDPYLVYRVKNISDSVITVMYIDVYYIDATGKILKTDELLLYNRLYDLKPGEEIEHGEMGQGVQFPPTTAKILIFNRRWA